VWDGERVVDTGFRAARHGYRFANRFAWPVRRRSGLRALRAGLRLFGLQSAALGLCGGMCYAALDDYCAGRTPSDAPAPPPPNTPLYRHLLRRQIDSLAGLRVPLRVLAAMWRGDGRLQAMAIDEFARLSILLEQGTPTPLVLIRARRVSDPTANHQVLAVGYRWEPATLRATIALYDPNHPLEEPELTFTVAPGGRIAGLAQSTGEPLRGFFVAPYRSGPSHSSR